MFGSAVNFLYDWEYWQLYHKVTFDGPNKLILVNEGVTELNWKADVYSAWKEWVALVNHQDNAGYLPAMSVVGGENITADGSRKLGATFFLQNGWRIKPWAGDYRLVIEGNVYTTEGDPIYVPLGTNLPYEILIELVVSSITEIVEVNSGTGGVDVNALATAVWDKLASSPASGSYGALVSIINGNTNTINTRTTNIYNDTQQIRNDTASIEGQLVTIDARTANIETTANTINAKIDLIDDNINTFLAWADQTTDQLDAIELKEAIIETISREFTRYMANRTKIDKNTKTMTIYDDDGVTPWKTFALKNSNGSASTDEVAERVPI